ncbi:hypothetical protein [Streptomyces griseosporeus]|uniref:hypothetical protein n=1 Tax=Streptomyces griseosporeus TaxID=1910 RepID=UPI0036A669A7
MTNVPSHRQASAGKILGCAFTLAVAMNLAAAIWEPSGSAWNGARLAVSILFLIALGYYMVLRITLWRQNRERHGNRP